MGRHVAKVALRRERSDDEGKKNDAGAGTALLFVFVVVVVAAVLDALSRESVPFFLRSFPHLSILFT